MTWFLDIDVTLFRWINQDWANRFLDGLMPLMSGKQLLPVGLLVVACMAWKMGRRGLAAVLCLALVVGLGESLIISPLKDAFARSRPFYTLPDVRLLVGRGGSGSMPSAHAANWFCVTTILGLFWRPSLTLTLPLAVLVALSRVYNGVHYPSDILVGALLGTAYGAAGVLILEQTWIRVTRRWFHRLHAWLPEFLPRSPATRREKLTVDDEWSEVGLPSTEFIHKKDHPPTEAFTAPSPTAPPKGSRDEPSARTPPDDAR